MRGRTGGNAAFFNQATNQDGMQGGITIAAPAHKRPPTGSKPAKPDQQ